MYIIVYIYISSPVGLFIHKLLFWSLSALELFIIGPELFVAYLWKLLKNQWGSVPAANVKIKLHTSRATPDIHQHNFISPSPRPINP